MKKVSMIVASLLVIAGVASAMDSQFGYFQAQEEKNIAISVMVENKSQSPVTADLRCNHFDKYFCPTVTKRIDPGKTEELKVKKNGNGRCVYGKYRYSLYIAGPRKTQGVSTEVMGGYEESSLNSMPVEVKETFMVEDLLGGKKPTFKIFKRHAQGLRECPVKPVDKKRTR